MKVTAYDQASAFEALGAEWNALLRRSLCDQIFSTKEWQQSWWSAYEAGDLWVVALRDDKDRLAGIAPWFIEHRADGERVVRSVGCVDVTDYVDVIAEPPHAREIYRHLAEHLWEHRERFDRINLCNIPEESPSRTEFAAILQQAGFEVEVEMQEVCPVIPLPRTFDDYLARLDKKQRHELRRKMRRAESEGNVSWHIVPQDADIHAELERFLTLMAASHPEKARFLSDPKNVAFFKTIVPVAFERGWLQLAFIDVGAATAGAYLNFDYDNRILVYNSGLLPEAYGHLSPGIVLLTWLIQHAIETGRHVFDFLRGNETYKYRMGAVDTRVYKLKAKVSQN